MPVSVLKTPIGSRAIHKIFYLSLCSLPIFSTVVAAQQNEQAAQGTVFRPGKITSNPLKQHQRLQPMVDFLADKLQFRKAETLFAKTIPEMKNKLETGKTAMFTGSAYETAALIQSGSGEVIAFEDSASTSAFRVPFIEFQKINSRSSIPLLPYRGRWKLFEVPGTAK